MQAGLRPSGALLTTIAALGACSPDPLATVQIPAAPTAHQSTSVAAPAGPARHPVEAALRRGVGPDFEVVYDDMHGLHGGETISVRGDGSARGERRKHGGSEPQVREVRVSPADLAEIAALLVEIQAWEQREPERMPVPDESRAGMRVRAGGAQAGFWEWYNDLGKNKRLARVKKLLERLVPP